MDARRRSVTTKKTARRWLIVEVAEQAFGLDVEAVQELIDLGDQPVHRLHESDPHLLGVLRVRDAVVPLVDFRHLIGVPSMQSEVEEVVELLHQRRQDHI
ncbi:MAG TPA: chemotaxis protein CheW, partial [Planctomycetaceae bacterium]|nr:chemotaxis protein CheW [Planctomycetaceae bacterium]